MAVHDTEPLMVELNGVALPEDERERLLAIARKASDVVAGAALQGLQFDQTPWSFATLLMQSQARTYRTENSDPDTNHGKQGASGHHPREGDR